MTSDHGQSTQTFASIGIDIGKDVFHIVGFDPQGKIVLRKKFKRLALEPSFEKLPPSIVGLEACLSAHFVSRTLRRLGHAAAHHPGDLRQAVREGTEERLQRCRGHRRGGSAPQPARRAGEDAGSARPAGAASRARPAGVAPHGDDQPDPRLPHRARDRRVAPARSALRKSLFAILENRPTRCRRA